MDLGGSGCDRIPYFKSVGTVSNCSGALLCKLAPIVLPGLRWAVAETSRSARGNNLRVYSVSPLARDTFEAYHSVEKIAGRGHKLHWAHLYDSGLDDTLGVVPQGYRTAC